MTTPTSPFDLSGATALVTGATRGLGQAIALGLARAGADIIAASASQTSRGSETQHLVEAEGRRFRGLSCDFADRVQTHDLIDRLRDTTVDIVINNAGTIRRTPALSHSDEDWDCVLETNLTAPFLLSRALAKPMVDRGRGKIIFIASVLSYQGGVTVPGYASAKSGIVGLTKALSNEWAACGINVNAIAPGYCATDNTAELRNDPARSEAIMSRIPAGRWGEAGDIAGAAVYLASNAATYVHGTVLTVDGGWLAR